MKTYSEVGLGIEKKKRCQQFPTNLLVRDAYVRAYVKPKIPDFWTVLLYKIYANIKCLLN